MSDSLIAATGLTKQYQLGKNVVVPVLRGLDFHIERGEFVALVGPSGSGKSTLLNLLGAMDHPTGGTLMVDGHDLGHMKESLRAEYRAKTVGMIFQSFNLLSHLTARQNVLLPAILAGAKTPDVATRADQLLERVGLTARAHHRPTELSGGEQQRVAIVRSLMNKPRLLLADEPTGNLDQKTGHEILTILSELAKGEELTLLVVTHDPAVAQLANRQLHMVDGTLTEHP